MKRKIVLLIWIIIVVIIAQAQDEDLNQNALIRDLMREINLWRLNSGLEPLVYNPTLEQLAIDHVDYLVSVPSFTDIHAGRNGESLRERSQYRQYAWQTYGHPQLFSITEIAAIGSIQTAMNFWQNSDIHTRSVLNRTYREVGVAVRQYRSGMLFIVVLGGQPNVLPALADPFVDAVYLTNERNDWQGNWIGIADEYRFLNSDLEPLTNWLEWEPSVELPEINDDFFYIQYQDDQNRVTSRVPMEPVWWLSDEERARARAADLSNIIVVEADETRIEQVLTALPTATPTNTPTATPENQPIFMTSTPNIPTLTPYPTLTPGPTGFVRLEYDANYLTLINSSPIVADLYGMSLGNESFSYSVLTWEVPADEINIGALPPNHCLQLAGFNNGGINSLPECRFVRSYVTISEDDFFWLEGTFNVSIADEVIAVCSADAGICEFEVP